MAFFQAANEKNDRGSSIILIDITYNSDRLFMNECMIITTITILLTQIMMRRKPQELSFY